MLVSDSPSVKPDGKPMLLPSLPSGTEKKR